MPHSTAEKRREYLKRYMTPLRRALAAKKAREWYRQNRQNAAAQRRAYNRRHPKADTKASLRRYYEQRGGVRFAKLRERYGLSIEEIDVMLDAQRGVCAECSGFMARMNINRDGKFMPIKNFICQPCFCRLKVRR